MLLRYWSREDAIGGSSAHESTWLVNFLHKFPHFDAKLQPVDSAFAPTISYGESLVVLSALPVIWLLFTLLLFLIFFCVRCCQACLKARDQDDDTAHLADKGGIATESRTASCCLNLWLILFLFLLVVAVGAGYFANEETDNGIKDFVRAAERTKSLLVDSNTQLRALKRQIGNRNGGDTSGIYKTVDDFFPLLETVRGSLKDEDYKEIKRHVGNVKKNVENAETAIAQLAEKIPAAKVTDDDKPQFEDYIDLVKFIEEYRWLGTVCFYTWTALVGLLLIGGLSRASKCCLFFFAAVGMITLVLTWAVVGFYLGITVGSADLCHNTTDFFEQSGGYLVEPPSTLSDLITCHEDVSPYLAKIQTSLTLISNAHDSVNKAEQRLVRSGRKSTDVVAHVELMRDNLTLTAQRVLELGARLDCKHAQENIEDGVHAFCYKGVFGLGLLLLSGTLLGFSLTLLILLSSCAWRNFRSSSRFGSAEFDADCEHDPFLPAHTAAGGASFGGPGGHHYMSRRYGSQNNSPDLRYISS